jgi:ABC-type phosphate transport system permease subunit
MNVVGGETHAYSTAVVLLLLLLAINSFAIALADKVLKRKVKFV